ncbi:MAG: hypothetical protein ACI8QY_001005 [bacterium]|jgi:uncharacterized protein (TIGR01777 family)
MHILITGGTGFVGFSLVRELLAEGNTVTVLVHKNAKVPKGSCVIHSLNKLSDEEKIDAIINLAGAPISKRWSDDYKKIILSSRINATKDIVALIKRLKNKPNVLVSASAIGYYGNQKDGNRILHENSKPQQGFTHNLCKEWETESEKARELGVRVCIARLGVVLEKEGGALGKMLPPFKLCLGGVIGSGKQYFSWIHRDDVINAFKSFLNSQACGTYNLTAPTPVTNEQFTKSLAENIHRPAIFPMPAFMVKLLFGEMGREILLGGQRVVPQKLQQEGFIFKYPEVDEALRSIVKPR